MRSKQEIINYLDSVVNQTLRTKPSSDLDGECVTLIKNIFDFLGVPEPYKARGHAKDAATNYVKDGIAENGRGWLTICVNPDMGDGYGHIWIDVVTANYEQNGRSPRHVTKNTRPISQSKQFVNLDKWIGETMTEDGVRYGILSVTGQNPFNDKAKYEKEVKYWVGRDSTEFSKYLYGLSDYYVVALKKENTNLKKQLEQASGNYVKVTEELYRKA